MNEVNTYIVHHRIYVPQQIKTIHHTKIVKVPEHHHYFHEKEKIIHIETPHKEEELKLPSFEHDHLDDFSELETHDSYYHEGGEHNIFKKHAPALPKSHKKIKVTRGKKRKLN
ncbi:hypothetical protein NQ314_000487 [Rhamnusium bicolor]|uniref:Uncharacterized protein n=1 Tax=Rhamnusium bicolor TaxID=1586634 RepID=A0AAV8ZY49_9CUCU|nr:hypothetical protein NQ314_000487 [Rhamnusium bicolor]